MKRPGVRPLLLVGLLLGGGCEATPGEGDAQAVTPAEPPPPLRACRDAARDADGGFCDATALWRAAERFSIPPGRREGSATFLSAADFDGDGRPDLFLTNSASGRPALLLWRDGGFVNASASWNLPTEEEIQSSGVADFDGDGRTDLAVGSVNSRELTIYRNEGSRFAMERARVPLGADPHMIVAAVPWDLDRDGRLDLLLGSYRRDGTGCELVRWGSACSGGLLAFRQVEPWRFEPVPVALAPRRVLGVRVFDWDDDGVDEVLVVSDFGIFEGANALLRVRPAAAGGVELYDATAGTGFGVAMFGMGLVPFDVDGDGRDEIYVPNIGPNALFQRSGGVGRDVAVRFGADSYGMAIPGQRPVFPPRDPENAREGPLGRYQEERLRMSSPLFPTSSWAALVMDYDDDGVDDLFVPKNGNDLDLLFPVAPDEQSVMLRGTGGVMADATAALRLGQRHDTSMAVTADFDGDGDLDLALMLEADPGIQGGLQLLRNDASVGRSLVVRARGRGAARDGIGAMIELRVGSRRSHRRLEGNLSVSGSGPNEAHFGLGSAAAADELTVRFPSGAVVRREGVPAGLVVVEE